MKSFLYPLKETFNDCLYSTFNLDPCSLFSGQVLREEALVSRLIKNKYRMFGDNV